MTSEILTSNQYPGYVPANNQIQSGNEQFRLQMAILLPNAGFHKLYPKPPISPEVRVQCCLPEPTVCFHDNMDIDSETSHQYMLDYEKSFCFNREQVELLTRGQRNNDVWGEARKGRLTASNFGTIMKAQKNTSIVMGYYGHGSSDALEWGKKRERVALAAYLKETNKGESVQESELLISVEHPFLGASPDGVVIENEKEVGLVQIKCPYKHRHITPEQAATSDKTFCCSKNENGTLELKTTHNYYYQVQGQMAIKGCEWCDFVIWTTKGLSIQRINFDDKLWQNMKSSLIEFYRKNILPEVFTLKLKREIQNK